MAKPRQIKNDILRLREKGYSYNEICKALNCAKSTVNYHCKINNLTDTGKKKHPVPKETVDAIYYYCKENTVAQAVANFGLSKSTIKKYKKRVETLT